MSNRLKMISTLLMTMIVASFFLPWITVESQQVGMFSKVLTGKKQATLDSISGFRVPIMANAKDARLMISIIKIFNPSIKDADKKSYLVWLIPILGIFMYVAQIKCPKNKILHSVIMVLGPAIFFAVTFKILSTDLNKLVINVKVSYGMWLILVSYLGLGTISFFTFMQKTK